MNNRHKSRARWRRESKTSHAHLVEKWIADEKHCWTSHAQFESCNSENNRQSEASRIDHDANKSRIWWAAWTPNSGRNCENWVHGKADGGKFLLGKFPTLHWNWSRTSSNSYNLRNDPSMERPKLPTTANRVFRHWLVQFFEAWWLHNW